jgi:hypothetical protein
LSVPFIEEGRAGIEEGGLRQATEVAGGERH